MKKCRAPLTLLVMLFASAVIAQAQYTDRDFLVTHFSRVECTGCDPSHPGTLLRIKGRGVVTSITPTDNTWVIGISGKLDHQPLMCKLNAQGAPSDLHSYFDGKVGDTVIVQGEDAYGENWKLRGKFPAVSFDCSLQDISDPNLHGITRGDYDPLCQKQFIEPGTDLFKYCRTIEKQ